MNILYILVLLCVIYHVFTSETSSGTSQVSAKVSSIADSYEGQKFREAIEIGDMGFAGEYFYVGNDEEKKYYGEYLISLESDRVVDLIKNVDGDYSTRWLLGIVFVYAKEEFIDKVFNGFKASDGVLSEVARNKDLA